MSVNQKTVAQEARRELIERLRTDQAFAEALIEDPVGPLEGTELAVRLQGLEPDEVQGYAIKQPFESNCCITGIY